MVNKVCVFTISVLSIAYLGHAVTEIQLDDVDVHYISNPYTGRSIGIAKHFLETLVSCHIIFPNGNLYEAYPTSNIRHPNITFGTAAQPFTGCNVEFKGVGVDVSGVYELLSTVRHRADGSLSITTQKFNITITLSDYRPPDASASSVHIVDPHRQ